MFGRHRLRFGTCNRDFSTGGGLHGFPYLCKPLMIPGTRVYYGQNVGASQAFRFSLLLRSRLTENLKTPNMNQGSKAQKVVLAICDFARARSSMLDVGNLIPKPQTLQPPSGHKCRCPYPESPRTWWCQEHAAVLASEAHGFADCRSGFHQPVVLLLKALAMMGCPDVFHLPLWQCMEVGPPD